MSKIGVAVLIAVAVGAALYFGGFVGGGVDVQLTDRGRTTVNTGVDRAAEGVRSLKVETPSTQK